MAVGRVYALVVPEPRLPSPESAPSGSPLLEVLERRQRRMERRQRRMELVLVVLLTAVLAGHLAAGRSGAIAVTVVASAVIGYAWVVRGIRSDAGEAPQPTGGDAAGD